MTSETLRILCVDDDTDIRTITVMALGLDGGGDDPQSPLPIPPPIPRQPSRKLEPVELPRVGTLTVPVAATHPLPDAADALAGFRSGKLGKIVVTVP